MNTYNFPDKKYQRQVRAHSRLVSRGEPSGDTQQTKYYLELSALDAAVSAGSRRDVRTKKKRGTSIH